MKSIYLLVFFLFISFIECKSQFNAQDSSSLSWNKFRFSGYGVLNYYNYDWEVLPNKRNAVDVERFNLYTYYDFTDKLQFKSEIEFEHGGTGSTMSFDPLEEFGEFEPEIEKGGKVVLEQINLLFKINPKFNVRAGKMRFYMGNASKQDRPRQYFTPYRSEIENTLIPLGWYETGVEFSGDFNLNQTKKYPLISYKAYMVTGLDNTGFSSYNWIRRGYQSRFEQINANSFAYALRLDYVFSPQSEIGFCTYINNPTPNRPKNDFENKSYVTYSDIHFTYESEDWRLRAYGLYSTIQNSAGLSEANRNLSNNLNVKRTPMGSSAMGGYLEAAFRLNSLMDAKTKFNPLYLYGRAEWFDSMHTVENNVSDNPRYERKIVVLGLNYFIQPTVVVKTAFSFKTLGSGERENTYSLGMGFDF